MPYLHPGLMLPLALLACGDVLAPREYRGEPVAVFELTVSPSAAADSDAMRMAVFWLTDLSAARDFDAWIEAPSTSVRLEPSRPVQLGIFDAPDQYLLEFAPGLRAGFGSVFSYVDSNGDGQRQPNEAVVGELDGRILVYAPAALAAAHSPSGRALKAGIQALPTRLPCHLASSGASKSTCDAPLGAACQTDTDCGVGLCLPDADVCVVADDSSAACRPADALLVVDLPAHSSQPSRYFVPACQDDAGCQTGRCDAVSGQCMPLMGGERLALRGFVTGPLVCDDAQEPGRGFECVSPALCEQRSGCFYREFDGSAYLGCGRPEAWPDAQAFCRSYGGDLVTVDDALEEAFLLDQGFDGWIGLNRWSDGEEEWSDGSASTYRNWRSIVLGNLFRDEHCTVMKRHPRRFWRLEPCEADKPFLCEARL